MGLAALAALPAAAGAAAAASPLPPPGGEECQHDARFFFFQNAYVQAQKFYVPHVHQYQDVKFATTKSS